MAKFTREKKLHCFDTLVNSLRVIHDLSVKNEFGEKQTLKFIEKSSESALSFLEEYEAQSNDRDSVQKPKADSDTP